MRQLVNAGKKSPVVRQLAVSLTKGLIQKDWDSEVNTLYKFVRDRIRYVRDINGVETLHTPEKILENAAGDCDDKSILLASLLESLGYRTRLVAVGFRKNSFSHVYPEVLHNNNWVSLETTEPVDMGWKPKNIVTSLILNTTHNHSDIHGLAGKRVKAAMSDVSAKLVAARAAASAPGATQADIDALAVVEEEYNAFMVLHAAARAKKKKKAMKKWGIIAAIVTAVVGVFTFGAGASVLQSAFEALKQGATSVAKSLLLSSVASAAKKGASKKEVDAAIQAANDLEKYPPDKNLTSLADMVQNSQLKKQVATEKTAAVLIPAGIVAAITFLS